MGRNSDRGGEPTLHPQFEEILQILNEYRSRHLPSTWIQINTNGYSSSSRALLSRLPPGIDVYSSEKKDPHQRRHCAFNIAPLIFSGMRIFPSVENKLALNSPLLVFFRLYGVGASRCLTSTKTFLKDN
jgi:pyruvate-formate lyase-activating enzyme